MEFLLTRSSKPFDEGEVIEINTLEELRELALNSNKSLILTFEKDDVNNNIVEIYDYFREYKGDFMFNKNVILENKDIKLTLVEEESTECCSIGISINGCKPTCKFISKELHDKLIDELINQSCF